MEKIDLKLKSYTPEEVARDKEWDIETALMDIDKDLKLYSRAITEFWTKIRPYILWLGGDFSEIDPDQKKDFYDKYGVSPGASTRMVPSSKFILEAQKISELLYTVNQLVNEFNRLYWHYYWSLPYEKQRKIGLPGYPNESFIVVHRKLVDKLKNYNKNDPQSVKEAKAHLQGVLITNHMYKRDIYYVWNKWLGKTETANAWAKLTKRRVLSGEGSVDLFPEERERMKKVLGEKATDPVGD